MNFSEWVAAVDARHKAIERAERDVEACRGSVTDAARWLADGADGTQAQEWRLDHLRKSLAMEAEAGARWAALLETPMPELDACAALGEARCTPGCSP